VETDTSFLKRWSLRKTEASREQNEQSNETEQLLDNQDSSEVTPPLPDKAAEISADSLSDEDMPAIDSLDEHSNFQQFFSEGVSEALRQQALRKLFNLPEFHVRDGLNDYDQDFSNITPLAEAAAGQIRQWIHQQKDDFTAALQDDSNDEESAEPIHSSHASSTEGDQVTHTPTQDKTE